MMMPANYSAIAENEMTYVVGGGLIDFLGSFTAPVFTVDNLKTLNTNLVTIIGNTYTQTLINNTLGLVFTGDLSQNVAFDSVKKNNVFVKAADSFKNGIGDGIATVLGLSAAVYNLGRADVKSYNNGIVLGTAGTKLL